MVGMRHTGRITEQHSRRSFELDHGFGDRCREPLPSPDVPGHARPPPRIDLEVQRGEGLDVGPRRHAVFIGVAAVLAADDVGGLDGADLAEQAAALVTERAGVGVAMGAFYLPNIIPTITTGLM